MISVIAKTNPAEEAYTIAINEKMIQHATMKPTMGDGYMIKIQFVGGILTVFFLDEKSAMETYNAILGTKTYYHEGQAKDNGKCEHTLDNLIENMIKEKY